MRERDSFAASTDAQAFVIGAVLIITIAVTATTLYLAINAPIETKKCEFQHSIEVTEDFIMLNSSVNYLARAESSVASISVPIKMTPTKESSIALPLSSGSLTLSPEEGDITLKLNEIGTGNHGTWTINNFTGNFSILYGNVELSAGNITLEGPPYASACIVSDMSNIFGHIGNDTGSNSTIYEEITWHANTSPPATEIIMKVRTSIFPNMTNATNWIEVEYGENLSSRLPTLNGHRYVQFQAELKTWDPSKTPTLFNVSINFSSSPEGVTLANSSGSISFASNYHYLPNHVLTYENGAVIKSQEGGGFVLCPFNFSFNNASGVPRINISLVNLTGTDVTPLSGAPVTSVRLFRGDYKLISDSFFYPNLTLNISTEYPSIWGEWFNKTLKDSGLDDYYYNVSVNATAKNVLVEFYGHGDGVQLYLEKTTVAVTI